MNNDKFTYTDVSRGVQVQWWFLKEYSFIELNK